MTRTTEPVPLLQVSGLSVTFPSEAGPIAAVRGLSYHVMPGEVLGIVGESGSGKSVSAFAARNFSASPTRIFPRFADAESP
jgi:peptide/nickel transport system ATP-binding protein